MNLSKLIVVMPGFNVASVLPKTVAAIPPGVADEVIFVDDGSQDGSGTVAADLGLHVVAHQQNRGYGAAQKTGYREALARGAAVVCLLHGDNQYDPACLPAFASKVLSEGYAVVTGTRMVLGDVLQAGMPRWKYWPNRFLTALENWSFGTGISDYHNGYRAYSAAFLRQVPLGTLSDFFDFDTDIMIQAALRGLPIAEVPHPTRYRAENSQMPFADGVRYGLGILATVTGFWLHRWGVRHQVRYRVDTAPATPGSRP